jgi:coenzyme F420 hydrogenase subunit beta
MSPYLEYYDAKFGSFVPYRCTLCSDKMNELADISCGDAWFSELSSDRTGQSLVIVRNETGRRFLDAMVSRRNANLCEITIDRLMQLQGGREQFSFWKKRAIMARMNIARWLFCRKVPSYDNIPSGKPTLRDYVNSVLLHWERFLAGRRSLWWLLNVYWNARTRL